MEKPIPNGWYVVNIESGCIIIQNIKTKIYPASEKWKSKICSEKIWNAEIGVKYVGCSQYCLFLQSLLCRSIETIKCLKRFLPIELEKVHEETDAMESIEMTNYSRQDQ